MSTIKDLLTSSNLPPLPEPLKWQEHIRPRLLFLGGSLLVILLLCYGASFFITPPA